MFEPRFLFEHPILQYIPLPVEEQRLRPTPWRAGVRLTLLAGPEALTQASERLGWPSSPWPGSPGRLLFLLEGGAAEEAYYREHEGLLIGQQRPGLGQLFSLATERFYRPWVHFTLYDRRGTPLASTPWTQEATAVIAKETGEIGSKKGAGA